MNENISALVERIIFDPNELAHLKAAIRLTSTGQMTAQELKKKVIASRINMVEHINLLFSFYFNQVDSQVTIRSKECADKLPSMENKGVILNLTTQLEEREALLETIAIRLQKVAQHPSRHFNPIDNRNDESS